MRNNNRKTLISVITATIVVAVLVAFLASRVIIFTNYFNTFLEVSKDGKALQTEGIFLTLNRIEDIVDWPGACPTKSGYCRSEHGDIVVRNISDRPGHFLIRLSTGEITRIWSPTPSPAIHNAFVKKIKAAFEGEGYLVLQIEK